MKDHYSPEEVDTILACALQKQALPGDISREQLIKLAGEVGVTPEQLAAAEAEISARSSEQGQQPRQWTEPGVAGFHAYAEPDMEPLREQYREYRSRVMLAVRVLVVILVVTVVFGGSPNIADGEDRLSLMPMAVLLAVLFLVTYIKGNGPIRECSFRRWLRRRELLSTLRSGDPYRRLR